MATNHNNKGIPAWFIIIAVLTGLTGFHIWLHHDIHGVVNLHQSVIVAFLVLNLLINFWELGLFFTGDRIREEYLSNRDKYIDNPTQPAINFFKQKIPLGKILSFRSWTAVWSSYCYFDVGYSRRGSFGYNIDVGNGFSTILPATFFAFGMTFEYVSPQILGMIGIAMFWQMFYGTVVYFFQYFHAGRHKGHTVKDIILFVGTSNGMWFIFPIWGLLVSAWLILENSYRIFTDPAVSLWAIF